MTKSDEDLLPEQNGSADFGQRVQLNQLELASNLESQYDFIICGAGTSGCVVAGRLAADRETRVLLLEAGGTDETELVTNPNNWVMALGSAVDWGFLTEPNPNLNGRSIAYSMGKIVGGGSSINVSTWSRGHRADWDFYAAESGDPSWSYAAVLDSYRHQVEAWAGSPDPDYRGIHGTVHVQPAAQPYPFAFGFLEGAESAGLRRFPNANGRIMEVAGGCALVDETVRDGRRQSIFRSYLYPLLAQQNITVLSGALATRILSDRNRATGVEFHYQGQTHRAEATREVILSLGAIHTPKLLMQSGIGDPVELEKARIAVRNALPGVGRNLHDHVRFGCVWENTAQTPAPFPRSQTAGFWKSRSELDCPNFFCFTHQGSSLSPENAARFNPPVASWSVSVGMRPNSRGVIGLTGANPTDPVRIDANYLGDPQAGPGPGDRQLSRPATFRKAGGRTGCT